MFVVSDTGTPPQQSNVARALILFDAADRLDQRKDDDIPLLIPVRSENNALRQTVEVDVLATAKKGLADIDRATVKITSGIDDGKTLQVTDEGIWMVVGDKGKISFKPEANFTGNPRPIRFSVADTLGQRTKDAPLTITYSGASNQDTIPVTKPDIVDYKIAVGSVAPTPIRIILEKLVLKGSDDTCCA